MTNLAMNLKDAVGQYADRVALRLEDAMLTYRQLDDLSARVAGWLSAHNIGPDDRVGLMAPNVLAFPVVYYGILRLGAVVVPMNPLLKAREIEHYLGDSGARAVFCWHETAAEVDSAPAAAGLVRCAIDDGLLDTASGWDPMEPVAPRDDHDTAVILYTSGTTGSPKGAQLTHGNMRANAAVSASSLFGVTTDDVLMGCLPLFHAFGQTCAMNVAVVAGAAMTLIARFDPATALRLIERDRVTVFLGVPTMYVAMVQIGASVADTSTLRLCVSGGAALPGEVLRGFAETFGAQILEGYGLSETSPVASFNRVDRAKPGSIGVPIDGVEMRIVDEQGEEVAPGEVGEIVIRGHNVMRGYWNRPEATAEAIKEGWFHSGDMAREDEDGYFFIVDRKKELIIRGGYNVYPREIEEVLYEHPAVLEAAVIGVPHPTHGEEIGAAVALRPGKAVSAEEIRDYVKERVAAYKYPRRVWLVDALPKGPTGKILKRHIEPPEQA
ncbi:MAG: long-chain fatty acid--CoA ligase [Nocardioides sp.]|uniref:long-chain-fatty-acid--CoA ligase n=1 Tax=Nocardioides sp. TaxID=35761 RepID=UPI0039E5361C